MAGTDRTAVLGFATPLGNQPLFRGPYTTSATPLEPDLLQVPPGCTFLAVLSSDTANPVFRQYEEIVKTTPVNAALTAGKAAPAKTGAFEGDAVKPGDYLAIYQTTGAAADYYIACQFAGPSGLVQP